jgi:hypothetical protein
MCSEGAILNMEKVSNFRILKKGSVEKSPAEIGEIEVEEVKEKTEKQSSED